MSDFDEFESGYASRGKQYMVGKVSLSKLLEWSALDGVGIILAPEAEFIPQILNREVEALSVA